MRPTPPMMPAVPAVVKMGMIPQGMAYEANVPGAGKSRLAGFRGHGVKTDFAGRGGILAGQIDNVHKHLGEVGDGGRVVADLIAAAKDKGVRLLESDFVHADAERVNEGVVILRGELLEVVNLLLDGEVGAEAIEKRLEGFRGGKGSFLPGDAGAGGGADV